MPGDLRVTDRRYGLSPPLLRCARCDFIQAAGARVVPLVDLYERLDDPEYVAGRTYRLRQMRALLGSIRERERAPPLHLLDVGAGTGLLVEAAAELGIRAVGVEPSRAHVAVAEAHGLTVFQGTLPTPALAGERFDLVTLVDVIEHVDHPVPLLEAAAEHLTPRGRLVITSPDPDSLAARVLRGRWWHYRPAHVCFLSGRAMREALRRAGLVEVTCFRQVWWFSASYLAARIVALLMGERLSVAFEAKLSGTVFERTMLPLHTFDSWVWIATRPEEGPR